MVAGGSVERDTSPSLSRGSRVSCGLTELALGPETLHLQKPGTLTVRALPSKARTQDKEDGEMDKYKTAPTCKQTQALGQVASYG